MHMWTLNAFYVIIKPKLKHMDGTCSIQSVIPLEDITDLYDSKGITSQVP